MPEYVRVKDRDTGHRYSVIVSAVDEAAHQVLKQDAVDHVGDPLPPEFSESSSGGPVSGQSADTSKEKQNG